MCGLTSRAAGTNHSADASSHAGIQLGCKVSKGGLGPNGCTYREEQGYALRLKFRIDVNPFRCWLTDEVCVELYEVIHDSISTDI